MRKFIFFLTAAFLTSFLVTNLQAQQLVYTTKSKEANKMLMQGIMHMMNAERELAYQDVSAALKTDPDFVMGHYFMGMLSTGATKDMHFNKAKDKAAKISEAEKMMISLNDVKSRKDAHEVWAKLSTMYPNDERIQYMNVYTLPDSVEALNKMLEYSKKYPNVSAAYNTLGYMYLLNKNDTALARQYFEKYIQVYPEGYNPYDSMADYYEHIGDKENARKYYALCLEKFPFSVNANQKMQELK